MNAETNQYRVETLCERHNRLDFCCGVEALDHYLQQQAGQDARRRVTVPFVLVSVGAVGVLGFYTLANTAIDAAKLPEQLRRKLPKYPLIPATLLGRLAVDQRHRGQGLGEFLLVDALRRSLETSRQVASFAVVVDAKEEASITFYQRYGFAAFADDPARLFLPMSTVAQGFA